MKITIKRIFPLLYILLACNFGLSAKVNDPFIKNGLTQLRILTYNIHHCNPPSKPGKIDIESIARVINDQKPDLVALQEVDVHMQRSGNIDEASELAKKTGLHVFFAKAIDYDGGEYGIAILSKYPLKDPRIYPLPNPMDTEPRVFALAEVLLPAGKTLYFGVTHFDVKGDQNRLEQADEINRISKELDNPMILAGDLNAIPDSEPVKRLEQQFYHTCQSCDYTIPADSPQRTIDYILLLKNSPLEPISTNVIPEPYASDHLPVFAILKWKKGD